MPPAAPSQLQLGKSRQWLRPHTRRAAESHMLRTPGDSRPIAVVDARVAIPRSVRRNDTSRHSVDRKQDPQRPVDFACHSLNPPRIRGDLGNLAASLRGQQRRSLLASDPPALGPVWNRPCISVLAFVLGLADGDPADVHRVANHVGRASGGSAHVPFPSSPSIAALGGSFPLSADPVANMLP